MKVLHHNCSSEEAIASLGLSAGVQIEVHFQTKTHQIATITHLLETIDMGQLILVRHGQASFGADDYDQLSHLGTQQGIRLGGYWQQAASSPARAHSLDFDAVLIGSLKRHRQTWARAR